MPPCSRETCTGAGRYRPVLELRRRKDGQPTRMRLLQILMCEEHRRDSVLDHFLSEEGFDKICRHLREAGKTVPSMKLTRLAWEEPAEDELAETALLRLESPDPDDEELAS